MKLADELKFMKLLIVILMVLLQSECKRLKVMRRPGSSLVPHGVNLSFRVRNEFLRELEGIVIESKDMIFKSDDEDQPICQFDAKQIHLPSIEIVADQPSRSLKMIVRNAKIESHVVKKTKTLCLFENTYERTFSAQIDTAVISFSLAGKIPVLQSFDNVKLNLTYDSKWGKYSLSLEWAIRRLLNMDYVKSKINEAIYNQLWGLKFDYANETLMFMSLFESFKLSKNFLAFNLQIGIYRTKGYYLGNGDNLYEKGVLDNYHWNADSAEIPQELIAKNSDMVVVLDESVFSFALFTFSQITEKISIRNQSKGKRMVTISSGSIKIDFTLVYENFTKDLQIAFSFSAQNGKIKLKLMESESIAWNALGMIVKNVSYAEEWFRNFIAQYESYFSKEFLNPYLQNYVKQLAIADFRVVLGEGKAYIAASFKKN